MRRLNDDEIILTQNEIDEIREHIRDSLYREWDRYTDHHISKRSIEEGMKYMNKTAYELAEQLGTI